MKPASIRTYHHLLRGGRMTKVAGKAASYAPHLATALVLAAPLTLAGTGAYAQGCETSDGTSWTCNGSENADTITLGVAGTSPDDDPAPDAASAGQIDGAGGNDTITVQGVAVIDGLGDAGGIHGGEGADQITLSDHASVTNGGVIDGGLGDDTIIISSSGFAGSEDVKGGEGTGDRITLDTVSATAGGGSLDAETITLTESVVGKLAGSSILDGVEAGMSVTAENLNMNGGQLFMTGGEVGEFTASDQAEQLYITAGVFDQDFDMGGGDDRVSFVGVSDNAGGFTDGFTGSETIDGGTGNDTFNLVNVRGENTGGSFEFEHINIHNSSVAGAEINAQNLGLKDGSSLVVTGGSVANLETSAVTESNESLTIAGGTFDQDFGMGAGDDTVTYTGVTDGNGVTTDGFTGDETVDGGLGTDVITLDGVVGENTGGSLTAETVNLTNSTVAGVKITGRAVNMDGGSVVMESGDVDSFTGADQNEVITIGLAGTSPDDDPAPDAVTSGKVDGAGGNDTITVQGVAVIDGLGDAGGIHGGDGADSITLADHASVANGVINAGEGTDTIDISSAGFTGAENVDGGGGDGDSITLTGVDAQTGGGSLDAETITLNNSTVSGMDITADDLNLDGSTLTGANIAADTVTLLNGVSIGMDSGDVTSLDGSGDADTIILGEAGTSPDDDPAPDAVTSGKVDGAGGNDTITVQGVAVIDGLGDADGIHGGDGADQITLSDHASVSNGKIDGGLGDDTITISSAGFDGSETVTGGDGTGDVINLNGVTGDGTGGELNAETVNLTNSTLAGVKINATTGVYQTGGDVTITGGEAGEFVGGDSTVEAETVTISGIFDSGGRFALAGGNDTLTVSDGAELEGNVNTGWGSDTVINAGTINGHVTLWTGVNEDTADNRLTNSGTIAGRVSGNHGSDIVTNSGTIEEHVNLGEGTNEFTQTAGSVTSVTTGSGDDTVGLHGGKVIGAVNAGLGDDLITLQGTVTLDEVNGGGANDGTDGDDTITATGATVTGGNLIAENVKLTNSTLHGASITTNSLNMTGGSATMTGGSVVSFEAGTGNESLTIEGGTFDKDIDMEAGNDTVTFRAAADGTDSFAGDETITGGEGEADVITLDGVSGNATGGNLSAETVNLINSTLAGVEITAGAVNMDGGDVTLTGGTVDRLNGGDNAETLTWSGGTVDSINTGAGIDSITVSSAGFTGNESISGGDDDADDTINLNGVTGNDTGGSLIAESVNLNGVTLAGISIFADTVTMTTGEVTLEGGEVASFTGSDSAETVIIASDATFTGSFDLGMGSNRLTNRGTFSSENVSVGADGTFINEGTFSPGGDGGIATIAINGNFVQTETGALNIDVDLSAKTGDLIEVSGTASLDGLVNVSVVNATDVSNEIDFLTAGSVTHEDLTVGDVSVVVKDTVFVTSDDGSVKLRFGLDFEDVPGLNENQSGVGAILQADLESSDSSAELQVIRNGLSGRRTDAEAYAEAISQLTPDILGGSEATALLSSVSFAGKLMSCNQKDGPYAAIAEGQCAWLKPQYRRVEQDATSASAGYDETATGISAGAQYQLTETLFIGGGFSFEQGDLSDTTGASSDFDQYQIGAVMKYVEGPWLFAASLSGGVRSDDITREVAFLSETATSTSDTDFFTTQLRAAYLREFDRYYVKPIVDLTWTSLNRDDVVEEGAANSNLFIQGGDNSYLTLSPSVEIGRDITLSNDRALRAFAKVGATYITEDSASVTAGFVAAPSNTFTTSTEIDQFFGDVELGATLFASDLLTVSGSYQGRFSSNTTGAAVNVKLNMAF